MPEKEDSDSESESASSNESFVNAGTIPMLKEEINDKKFKLKKFNAT